MPLQNGVPEKNDEDVKFEEAMTIAGYGKFSIYIMLVAGMSICVSMMGSVDVSFLLPAAECDFQLTSSDKGLLSSAYFIGTITASHLSGFLADTLGRRYILLRGMVLNTLTYILGALAPQFWVFFVLKVISGIVTSPCMVAAIPFLGEYVPAKRRPQTVLLTTSLSLVGLVFPSVVGWLVLMDKWSLDLWFVTFTPWRLFYLLCGLPSLLCAVFFYLAPESPKFLLNRGKKNESIKVLQRVYSINTGSMKQTYPVNSVSMDSEDVTPPIQGKGIMGAIKQIGDQTLPLFQPPYLKRMMGCLIMMFTFLLCFTSVFLWLPEIIIRIATYKESHEGEFLICQMVTREQEDVPWNTTIDSPPVMCDATMNSAVFLPNLFMAGVNPLLALVATLLFPYVDRRIIMSVVVAACGGISLLLMYVTDAVVIVSLFGSIPIILMVAGNIFASIMIEIFPTYIRAMSGSMTLISGRLGSIVGAQLFSQLIDSHCTLMFQFMTGLLICVAAVPMFLDLKIGG